MRRVLAILKYVPAVLCGLLVVAWVVSLIITVGLHFPLQNEHNQRRGDSALFVHFGSIGYGHDSDGIGRLKITAYYPDFGMTGYLGGFLNEARHGSVNLFPIPFLLTLLLPAALAPFTRFPLWSYFAWTALLAAELAYYLR